MFTGAILHVTVQIMSKTNLEKAYTPDIKCKMFFNRSNVRIMLILFTVGWLQLVEHHELKKQVKSN